MVLPCMVPLAAVLTFALIAAGPSGRPDPGPVPASAHVAAGTIEGSVALNLRPPRRTAAAYPARGAQAPRQVQVVPAVVYLKGTVAGAAGGGGTPRMAQTDTTFAPPVLVVRTGTAVSFPNEDPFFHNVFSYSGPERFDLGRYPKGESKSVTFDEAGVVKIYCEVHDFMRSAVIVTESGVHKILGTDGRFSLSGIPPGTYTLVAWHVDLGQVEREISVKDGETTRVELSLG